MVEGKWCFEVLTTDFMDGHGWKLNRRARRQQRATKSYGGKNLLAALRRDTIAEKGRVSPSGVLAGKFFWWSLLEFTGVHWSSLEFTGVWLS